MGDIVADLRDLANLLLVEGYPSRAEAVEKAADEVSRMTSTLLWIDRQRYTDRSTINPGNAFDKARKLNLQLVAIMDRAAAALAGIATTGETLETYYRRQVEWSRETFGPGLRTKGVIDHIRKELAEIEAKPDDLSEWIDVVILAMDGYWRHGGKPEDLLAHLLAKQQKNMARNWPDWRSMSEDSAIEHDRSAEPTPGATV